MTDWLLVETAKADKGADSFLRENNLVAWIHFPAPRVGAEHSAFYLDKLDSFLIRYPRAPQSGWAMLACAKLEDSAGRSGKATRWLQRILTEFPLTPLHSRLNAQLALVRLEIDDEQGARHHVDLIHKDADQDVDVRIALEVLRARFRAKSWTKFGR